MNTHADKAQENKSQSVVNEASKKQSNGESTFQLVDNRPEALAQRKLQEVLRNSSKGSQLKAFQETANNSTQTKQLKVIQAMANQHPQMPGFKQLKIQNNPVNGIAQRVKWDLVKNAPDNYKTEIFGGVSWRKYLAPTDAGTFIEVFKGENKISTEEKDSGYGQTMMKKGDDSGLFNCHGFTFGGAKAVGGPFGILDAGPVKQILTDEYKLQGAPSIGCVVIFGDANHSGIVVDIAKGSGSLDERVMVRSKLGTKDFSTESIKALSRFGDATYYSNGGGILGDEVDLKMIEEQAREIEERARQIRELETGMEDIHRLQIILAKLTSGGKPTEQEMEFINRMRHEVEANKISKKKESIQKKAIKLNSTDTSEGTAKLESSNNTSLPDTLKVGVESLSGHSMDDVKVHYNSEKPAQLQAHAYAQGSDIYLGPGQEKHLPHEAWHVAQQKQGRVRPTTQMKGDININDNSGLEKEADEMGAKAAHIKAASDLSPSFSSVLGAKIKEPVQGRLIWIKNHTVQKKCYPS